MILGRPTPQATTFIWSKTATAWTRRARLKLPSMSSRTDLLSQICCRSLSDTPGTMPKRTHCATLPIYKSVWPVSQCAWSFFQWNDSPFLQCKPGQAIMAPLSRQYRSSVEYSILPRSWAMTAIIPCRQICWDLCCTWMLTQGRTQQAFQAFILH